MKAIFICSILLIISFGFICGEENKTIQVKVKNPNNFIVEDAYVEFNYELLPNNFIIKDGSEQLPYQIIKNESGMVKVCFVLNMKPNEEKNLTVIFDDEITIPIFKKRTYAELAMKPVDVYYDGRYRGNAFMNVTKIKVPSIHTDHS